MLWLKNKGQLKTAILNDNVYLDAGFFPPSGLGSGRKTMGLGLVGFPGFGLGWRMGHSIDSERLVIESCLPSLVQLGLARDSAVAGAL